jgi:hypothetical protein
LTRASGEPLLRTLVAELPRCYAILGNHDLAISRDPFVERTLLPELEPATLLSDEGVTIEVRGRRVYIAGADPRSRWARSRPQPADLAVGRDEADLRILIVHIPALVDGFRPAPSTSSCPATCTTARSASVPGRKGAPGPSSCAVHAGLYGAGGTHSPRLGDVRAVPSRRGEATSWFSRI